MPAAKKCVCRFWETKRPIRDNFYRFQTVLVMCERSLNTILPFDFPTLERLYNLSSFLVGRTLVHSGKNEKKTNDKLAHNVTTGEFDAENVLLLPLFREL